MMQKEIPLTPREMALAALQDMDVDNELTPEGILQALECGRIRGYGDADQLDMEDMREELNERNLFVDEIEKKLCQLCKNNDGNGSCGLDDESCDECYYGIFKLFKI